MPAERGVTVLNPMKRPATPSHDGNVVNVAVYLYLYSVS